MFQAIAGAVAGDVAGDVLGGLSGGGGNGGDDFLGQMMMTMGAAAMPFLNQLLMDGALDLSGD